jgi:hypothetical protein
VRRVVIGTIDPNPLVHGRGIRRLRAAGMQVDVGILRAECDAANEQWFKFITRKLPWVALKAAVTLDGKLATASGDSRWVTGRAARARVHALRDRLEPDRPKRAASQFVLAEHGGYRLNLDAVRIDADVFERAAETGLAAYREGDEDAAMRLLTDAVGAYAGDFLAEERYTLWVLAERERLQELAVQALMTLGTLCWQAERLGDAAAHLERVATMLPFDQDVERRLIAITLQRGHRSRARRRYMALRARMLREFGEEPDFQLADVLASVGRPRRLKWREPA